MPENTHSVSLKFSLGDFAMLEAYGAGSSAQGAKTRMLEVLAEMTPSKAKQIALRAKQEAKSEADKFNDAVSRI